MCVRSHQETDPRDHLGVVDLQPGLVEVEVGVGDVEHADAQDEPHPAGHDGSQDVTAMSQEQLLMACVRARSRTFEEKHRTYCWSHISRLHTLDMLIMLHFR